MLGTASGGGESGTRTVLIRVHTRHGWLWIHRGWLEGWPRTLGTWQ